MFSELFGLLSSVDVRTPTKGKFEINLNKNRIRSISSYSSKNIFYFPTVVSDQCTLEEVTMISRALEKQYASFVVACISLMPFHRIRADDRGSIEEYLSQFHQNLGISSYSGDTTLKNMIGMFDESTNTDISENAQEFFYKIWKESLSENSDFYQYITENYIPLSEMFNKDAVDPYTKILQERFNETSEEMDTWGFIGYADEDDFDEDDDDDFDDEIDDAEDELNSFIDDELNEGVVKNAIDNIKFTLEMVSENKIKSCPSLTKLRTLESKLKSLKKKYTKYLNRYKKKYNENKKNGTKSKLAIRFNNMSISDPKAFMKQYGSYIKIINKRLKACEKRRAELLKRKDMSTKKTLKEGVDVISDLTHMDFEALDKLDASITESLQAPDSEIFSLINEDLTFKDIENLKNFDIQELDIHYEGKNYSGAHKNGRMRGHKSDVNPSAVVNASDKSFKAFDREVFTNMDMKKSNDMVPTFTKATIGFIVDDTEEVVNRDIIVGIKTYIHKAPTAELVNDIYNAIINKRKFLKFIKFITGEERSLADLLFGFKELRTDALDTKKSGSQWRSAFKRRKRWSKMTIPYLTKEYTPNGTVVMTMNEVNYIKETYGIDLMKDNHCKMIMDTNFLLGFVILDQANEIAYIMYDGQSWQFQEYTYNMLEREQQMTDRMMRELYRSFSH